MTNNPKLEAEVEIIRNDMVSFQSILDKFDVTINKLSDVSNTLNKVIAVQEQRIEAQEKSLEVVHNRIDSTKEEMRQEMSNKYSEILNKLSDIEKSQKQHSEEITKRVNNLEKWRYIVMGGGIVIGFLLSETTLWNNIF